MPVMRKYKIHVSFCGILLCIILIYIYENFIKSLNVKLQCATLSFVNGVSKSSCIITIPDWKIQLYANFVIYIIQKIYHV